MNADIAAKIRLYLNFYRIIKIKIHNGVICVHLCLSVVNNEIRMIPACFLSAPPFLRWCLRTGAHALNVGWEWCVRAVFGAAGGGHGC